jgi:hypothetical protein
VLGPGILGFRGFPLGRHPEPNGMLAEAFFPDRTGLLAWRPRASDPFDRFGPKVHPLSGLDRRDDRPPGRRMIPAGPCLWRASFPPEGGPSKAHRSAARRQLHESGWKRRRASLASPGSRAEALDPGDTSRTRCAPEGIQMACLIAPGGVSFRSGQRGPAPLCAERPNLGCSLPSLARFA